MSSWAVKRPGHRDWPQPAKPAEDAITILAGLNLALSNDPWAEKRGELAQHSALRLNARLVHDYPESFNEDTIDKRGGELASLLIDEWPGPGADDWE